MAKGPIPLAEELLYNLTPRGGLRETRVPYPGGFRIRGQPRLGGVRGSVPRRCCFRSCVDVSRMRECCAHTPASGRAWAGTVVPLDQHCILGGGRGIPPAPATWSRVSSPSLINHARLEFGCTECHRHGGDLSYPVGTYEVKKHPGEEDGGE